jgi:hypothetical protein
LRINRRSGERTALSTVARLATPTGEHSVKTADISAEGACVLCNTSIVGVSQRVHLTIAGRRLAGSIAWTSMDRAGIRFDRAVPTDDFEAIVSAPRAY